jgi:hypothetical protein
VIKDKARIQRTAPLLPEEEEPGAPLVSRLQDFKVSWNLLLGPQVREEGSKPSSNLLREQVRQELGGKQVLGRKQSLRRKQAPGRSKCLLGCKVF